MIYTEFCLSLKEGGDSSIHRARLMAIPIIKNTGKILVVQVLSANKKVTNPYVAPHDLLVRNPLGIVG
jgi:hypothetical protein